MTSWCFSSVLAKISAPLSSKHSGVPVWLVWPQRGTNHAATDSIAVEETWLDLRMKAWRHFWAEKVNLCLNSPSWNSKLTFFRLQWGHFGDWPSQKMDLIGAELLICDEDTCTTSPSIIYRLTSDCIPIRSRHFPVELYHRRRYCAIFPAATRRLSEPTTSDYSLGCHFDAVAENNKGAILAYTSCSLPWKKMRHRIEERDFYSTKSVVWVNNEGTQ